MQRRALIQIKRHHKVYWLLLTTMLNIILMVPMSLNTPNTIPKMTHQQVINKLIAMNHPNPQLIRAIIHVESKGDSKAISTKGAIGLMQVLPQSGKEYAGVSRTELFDIEKNIQVGCKIVKIYERTSPNLKIALGRYSGGAKGYYQKVMKAMRG